MVEFTDGELRWLGVAAGYLVQENILSPGSAAYEYLTSAMDKIARR